MATDLERLVVQLEASTVKYERAMQRALSQTNTTAKRIESRFATMGRGLSAGFVNVGRGVATAFAGAAALRGAQQLIDANTRVQNSLKVAGLEGESLSRVYDDLFDSAQRNMAPIESLATLYSRAAQVQKELGASTEDLTKFTDNVAMALRVSGTSAQEAQGALMQLGQALGSARVMAEEFNSINEGARPILQAAAAGIAEAGGSVSKLKQLVNDGKVSNQAFFQGIQAGSVILEDKLAGAEVTVSQSFVRLQNVLIDVAGKFNDSSGAGQRFAGLLDQIGSKIEEIANSPSFDKMISDFFDEGARGFEKDARDIERIANAIQQVHSALRGTELENEAAAANAAAVELEAAQKAMEDFAIANGGVFTPEVEAAFRDLINQIIEGKGNAEAATQAIMAMGTADPNFDKVIGSVSILITHFLELRDAANAALGLAGQASNFSASDMVRGNSKPPPAKVEPVTLADYPVIGGSGGSGGGKKSPSDRFQESLEQQERRTANLRAETAALAALNPLVNDYGFAVEKLRVQQDLENDAARAGLELTPERKAAIEELATGYANAAVEAEMLAQAQDNARKMMEDFADMGKSSLRGFIDDLREGKSATEALGNALGNLGDRLLDLALDSLFSTSGGGGILGGLFSIFGFSKGGIASKGRPVQTFANGGIARSASIFGEAGPEAAVPLPDGRRIPVELRMQQGSAGQTQVHVTVGVDVDASGNILPFVKSVSQETVSQAAPAIVATSVNQANRQAPAAMAQHDRQRSGGDYRLG